jgi:hypothetical protein
MHILIKESYENRYIAHGNVGSPIGGYRRAGGSEVFADADLALAAT